MVRQIRGVSGLTGQFEVARRGVKATSQTRQLAGDQVRVRRLAHANDHIHWLTHQINLTWRQVKFEGDSRIEPGKFRNQRCQVDIGEIHRQ
ncbi:hypothetical protein D9M68_772000 [compost metagenome]